MGILTQPATIHDTTFNLNYPNSSLTHSYISYSVGQYVQTTGGIPVAVEFDLPRKKLLDVLENLQGIVFQGGSVDSDEQYSQTVRFVVEWAKSKNDQGRFFFVFAVCKGFEELAMSFAGSGTDIVKCGFDNLNKQRRIDVDTGVLENTKYLKDMGSEETKYVLESQGVTFYHRCGVSFEDFVKHLDTVFHLVGKFDMPEKEVTLVALIEHKKYPFIGQQFHPESPLYQIKVKHNREIRSLKYHKLLLGNLLRHSASDIKVLKDLSPMFKAKLLFYRIPTRVSIVSEDVYLFNRWPSQVKGKFGISLDPIKQKVHSQRTRLFKDDPFIVDM